MDGFISPHIEGVQQVAKKLSMQYGTEFKTEFKFDHGRIVIPQTSPPALEEAGIKIPGRRSAKDREKFQSPEMKATMSLSERETKLLKTAVLAAITDEPTHKQYRCNSPLNKTNTQLAASARRIVGKIIDEVAASRTPLSVIHDYSMAINYNWEDGNLRFADGGKVFDAGTFYHNEASMDFPLREKIVGGLALAEECLKSITTTKTKKSAIGR